MNKHAQVMVCLIDQTFIPLDTADPSIGSVFRNDMCSTLMHTPRVLA